MNITKKKKCCIITNKFNDELYEKTKSFYDTLDYDIITIDGKNNLYGVNFLRHVINNEQLNKYNYLICIDEDMIVTNLKSMNSLIEHVIDNDITVCGIPDGGEIIHRTNNPLAVNLFFCILNLKWIRENFTEDELTIPYYSYSENLLNHNSIINIDWKSRSLQKINSMRKNGLFFGDSVINDGNIPYDIKFNNFEPYYCFFFIILSHSNSKFEYIKAVDSNIDGGITTIVLNHKHEEIGYHTWYAREWNNPKQKNRINNIIDFCTKKIKEQ